jgi:hypothetical protein
MILLVTYDLKGPSTQYSKLYELLKGERGWSHYLASTWLVSTHKSAREFSEEIRQLVLPSDRFMVARLGTEYWGWMPKETWEWITNHRDQ